VSEIESKSDEIVSKSECNNFRRPQFIVEELKQIESKFKNSEKDH
jgi:hypothetical protein